jgi:hypothetical protein
MPLPPLLHVLGAAGTVALTVVMLARQRRAAHARAPVPTLLLPRIPGGRLAGLAARLLALAALLVVRDLAGLPDPLQAGMPALDWRAVLGGMALVSALAGDLWAHVNPLDTVFRFGERLWSAASGRAPRPLLHYPAALGAWPAALLLLALSSTPLAWEGRAHASTVAAALLAYAAATWLAMLLFGRAAWLGRGEVFSVVFGLLARFAPFELHHARWRMRPYAAGLLVQRPAGMAQVVLVMALLACATLDGLRGAEAWQGPAWMRLAMPVLFLAAYLLCCVLTGRLAAGATARRPFLRDTAGLYVLALVPIAIAFQFAHKLPLLAAGFASALTVWFLSLLAVILGHLAAVWLAQRMSLRQFPSRSRALRSQFPMLALMTAYTLLGLWILAQPPAGIA